MNLDEMKKFCIVGWGRSGVSLCRLLLSLKKEVMVTEIRPSSDFSAALIDKFKNSGVSFEFGCHSEKFIKGAGLIILSPGVDCSADPLKSILKSLNIPYVGEVEFSSWLTQVKTPCCGSPVGEIPSGPLSQQS